MDFETLFLVLASVFLVQSIGLLFAWRLNPEEEWVRHWAIGASLVAVACLITLTGIGIDGGMAHHGGALSPGNMLRSLGNAVAATGTGANWMACRSLNGHRVPKYRHLALLTLALALLPLFPPDSFTLNAWRIMLVSAATGLMAAACVIELLRYSGLRHPIVLMMTIMMGAVAGGWLLRALAHAGFLDNTRFYDVLSLYIAIVASMMLTISIILLTNERINGRLKIQALRDPLTGAMNRRAFVESANVRLEAMRRGDCGLAVAVIDLDHFKEINDRHGHLVGDMVLQGFAEAAQRLIRVDDLFARYGGEEFVLLMAQCSPGEAEEVLARLQEALAEQPLAVDGVRLRVSFSAGLCLLKSGSHEELESVLASADRAMYRAKEAGRDRIELCEVGEM